MTISGIIVLLSQCVSPLIKRQCRGFGGVAWLFLLHVFQEKQTFVLG